MIPVRLRRARLGVFGTFFVVGLVIALWVVNIPAIQDRTDVSHATLGGLLLLLGLGGVISMQVAGWVIARIGSKTTAVVGFSVAVAAINLPGAATDALTLGIALFVLGLGNGAADVAMNDQAVVVERAYGRPIMSAFHALWSVGGAVGAGLGAAAQALGLGLQLSLLIASVLTLAVGVVFLTMLLPAEPTPADAPTATRTKVSPDPGITTKVVAFGALAFLLMLSEGVANDWSALHAVEHLDQPDATASLAYGTFAVTMTIGRLTVDRVAHRFGPANVVRFGSLTAAIGIALVILSGAYPVTLAGWAVFGIGLAGVVPQLFTAAGNLSSSAQSVVLSRVVGAGYIGMLAGPAVIGWLAEHIGLTYAFVLPLAFCLAGVVMAPMVTIKRPAAEPATAEDVAQVR